MKQSPILSAVQARESSSSGMVRLVILALIAGYVLAYFGV